MSIQNGGQTLPCSFNFAPISRADILNYACVEFIWACALKVYKRFQNGYGVVVWTGETGTKTISVHANLFENGAEQLRFHWTERISVDEDLECGCEAIGGTWRICKDFPQQETWYKENKTKQKCDRKPRWYVGILITGHLIVTLFILFIYQFSLWVFFINS